MARAHAFALFKANNSFARDKIFVDSTGSGYPRNVLGETSGVEEFAFAEAAEGD